MPIAGRGNSQNNREGLSVGQLHPARVREQWTEFTGNRPPRYVSRTLLMRMLADRIQSAEYGGISNQLSNRLLKIAAAVAKGGPVPEQPSRRLKAGTVLVRDWKGARHRVMVLESGFAYGGRTHHSLSEVARTITGTRWSGPAFFGLRASRKTAGWKGERS